MQGWKKRLTAGVLIGAFLFSESLPGFAQGNLYEKTETQTIGSGVEYQHLLRFNSSGWQNVNVVTMDLKNANTKVDVVGSAKGVSSRDNLSTLVGQVQNPLAAINGDYFYMTTPDSPLGVMAKDGKLVSSTSLLKPYNVLSVTQDGQAFFGPWKNDMSVTSDKGISVPVSAYNKITYNYAMVTILDKNWGSQTPGADTGHTDQVEMVVRNGIVSEIRTAQPATAIPSDGYVLLASGERGQCLLQSFQMGDKLQFSPADLGTIRMAVGGGVMLVQNGTLVPLAEPVSGAHPRSAIGVTADGSHLKIVSVDGRHTSYTGLDGSQMASLMKELGCYNAMILDGGGSTTFLVKELGGYGMTLENVPSDGPQRKIINGIVISSTATEPAALGGIQFETGSDAAFVNHSIPLSLFGFDTNYQRMTIDSTAVTYTLVEGKGKVENQQLVPLATGNLVVEAAYQGKTARKTFRALSQIAAIRIKVGSNRVSAGGTTTVKILGIDGNGNQAELSSNNVNIWDDKGFGSCVNGVYTASNGEGSTILRASYQGFSAAAPLAVGLQKTPVSSFDKIGFAFSSASQDVTGAVAVSKPGKVNGTSAQLDYDFTSGTGSTATLAFAGGGIPVTYLPQKIGLWINASGPSSHELQLVLSDATGKVNTVPLQQGIDWTGWKYLTADVTQTLKAPIKIVGVSILSTDGASKTKGSIQMDGMDIQCNASVPTITQAQAGGVVKDPNNKKPAKYDRKWMIYSGGAQGTQATKFLSTLANGFEMALLTGSLEDKVLKKSSKVIMGTFQGYKSSPIKDGTIVLLNDSKDGLRKTDYNQWPWLQTILGSTTSKNLYVFLPKPIWGSGGFTDTLEADLLGEQLTALSKRGTKVYVFFGGGETGGFVRDGVWYIGTGKDPSGYVTFYQVGTNMYYTFDKFQ